MPLVGKVDMQNLICNVCGVKQWEPIYTKRIIHPLWWLSKNSVDINLNYIICKRCGYITLFPRLGRAEYKRYYGLAPAPTKEAFSARMNVYKSRKKLILKHMQKEELGLVIEIGPAYGECLLLLSEFKKRVGIEPSSTYCKAVKAKKSPIEYRCCMLEQVPKRAPELLSSADLIIASHVLEHAFDPRKFVRHMVNLTKPGGYVYIEVPSVEAMAKVRDPSYQSLHFGHISQFSTDVLNQLCVSESLEPVSAEVSTKNKYPAIRGLYKRPNRAETVAGLFQRHTEFIDAQAVKAKATLVEHLVSNKSGQTVLWGCGADLFDVLNLLDDSQTALLSTKAKLVDTNSGKQHKRLAGIEILDPTTLESLQVDTVLITSRSKLIQHDIIKNAKKVFSGAQYILLYP